MNAADLPWESYAAIVPVSMLDSAAYAVDSWALVGDLNGLGNAVVTMKLRPHRRGTCAGHGFGVMTLAIHVDPRTGRVAEIMALCGSSISTIPPATAAGNFVDLAQSIVSDNSARLLGRPSRRAC